TNSNIDLFANLVEKFPNVDSFQKALEENKNLKESIDEIILNAQNGEDDIMMTMDIMQYQDIHRQKIERVINVMRALSKYMSSLFEGKIEDAKRVSSAVHIQGDSTTEDIVTNEDIEALIESLGKK
ncbi:MAG: chemotaxis protein, partial [Campylobacteraceae bacterium]|nr:chemotaxis protein [Campylobacteraceae bacterium]